MVARRGNCYVAAEALYHILGGPRSGWQPYVMRVARGRETHWFLVHTETGLILDPSRRQFRSRPDYTRARGCGFLTRYPSARARALMETLTWQK